jgi:pseudaminic acid biosynthesis-associated methylase
MMAEEFRTEQEVFWAGQFGDDYIGRNLEDQIVAGNTALFARALASVGRPSGILEFGANIGLNLKALRHLYPGSTLRGIEINSQAAAELRTLVGSENVFEGSILDYESSVPAELVLIKGVLIHMNPDVLNSVYEKLYSSSSRYILVCEYYNPSPVSVSYRGHADRLFKRDFAGEMLDAYPSLKLLDYGFVYRRDPSFPLDDITWFLLAK